MINIKRYKVIRLTIGALAFSYCYETFGSEFSETNLIEFHGFELLQEDSIGPSQLSLDLDVLTPQMTDIIAEKERIFLSDENWMNLKSLIVEKIVFPDNILNKARFINEESIDIFLILLDHIVLRLPDKFKKNAFLGLIDSEFYLSTTRDFAYEDCKNILNIIADASDPFKIITMYNDCINADREKITINIKNFFHRFKGLDTDHKSRLLNFFTILDLKFLESSIENNRDYLLDIQRKFYTGEFSEE